MPEEECKLLVKLRFLGTAFVPEEDRVNVAVLRGDGTIARRVDKWPMVVELDAHPDTVIPLQICREADQSLYSTIHLPLEQVMKGVGTPAFCTLWLGLTRDQRVDSPQDSEAKSKNFMDALEHGQDLTYPKLGVGIRIVSASDPTGTTDVSARTHKGKGQPSSRTSVSPASVISSKSPPGMFRIVDKYEDVLADVYQKADMAVQALTMTLQAPLSQLTQDMRDSLRDTHIERLNKQMQQTEAESNRKVCSVLQQLATKQRQVNRLLSEVQTLRASRKLRKHKPTGENAAMDAAGSEEEQEDSKAVVQAELFHVAPLEDVGEPDAERTACLLKEALESPTSAGFCAGCTQLQLELAEARRYAHALACELEDVQQAAGHRVELQAKRAVYAMREIQEKAHEYEEDMRKRDTQFLALHEDLQKARQEAAKRAHSAIAVQAELDAVRKELGRRPPPIRTEADGSSTPSRPVFPWQRVPGPILQGNPSKEPKVGSPPRSPAHNPTRSTASIATPTSAATPRLGDNLATFSPKERWSPPTERRPRNGGKTVVRQRSGGLSSTSVLTLPLSSRSRPKPVEYWAGSNAGNTAPGVSRSPSPMVARLLTSQSSTSAPGLEAIEAPPEGYALPMSPHFSAPPEGYS